MRKFNVVVTYETEADTAEEAALLMYQELTNKQPPLHFSVVDESNAATSIILDREKADEFASTDHTADPGNW
ncbi:hypothetical protein [Rhizobium leucaenae]|uniref:Microcystin degradation protein MlrC n=1 Tax=Rhizobium leucaenae TaxID=29450 RepID=A0A7W6ZYW6_9HYPH|nr:hypothetical protein [Rhizobium leucaenae]MBB4570777.1 microcystin degradation protein MlrC [Rhizobium leucaenae]MBB6303682.1 microcystin degradation protein MlrC [Rhizobium leucaenae]